MPFFFFAAVVVRLLERSGGRALEDVVLANSVGKR